LFHHNKHPAATFVNIPGMLYYELLTSDPAKRWVVFLHGAGGSTRTWSFQVDAFKDHFNILLIDLRDHGQSKNIQPAFESYRFPIISRDIKKVLDQVGITKAHFVTLSFGSVVIQDLYMRYPGLIDRLIFAGGIFKGNVLIRSFVHLARIMNIFLSYSTMYSLFSYLLMPRKRNQKARRIYQMQAARLTQKEYMKWVGLYSEFFRLLNLFYHQQLNVRTLIVMGQEDYVFLKAAKSFSRRQKTVQLEIIELAGHVVNIDRAEEFNDVAITFLDEVNNEDTTPQNCTWPVPTD